MMKAEIQGKFGLAGLSCGTPSKKVLHRPGGKKEKREKLKVACVGVLNER